MLRRLKIRGLGPHIDTDIRFAAPMGSTTIIGSSEVGKSTLIDGVLFVLWGMDRTGEALDLRAIRDDAEEARVELELASGTTLIRTLRRSKSGGRGHTTRQLIEANGTSHGHKTDKAWLGALRDLGAHPGIARHVVVPHAWTRLTGAPGNGRRLRDVLVEVLPPAALRDIVAELLTEAGYPWRRGDPVSQKDAIELRRRAKHKLERSTGDRDRLAQLVAAAEADPVRVVPDGDLAQAKALLVRDEWWGGYDMANDGWEAREVQIRRAEEADLSWAYRFEALGARPPSGAVNPQPLREREEQLRQGVQNKQATLARLEVEVEAVKRQLEQLEEHQHPGRATMRGVNQAKRVLSDAIAAKEEATDVCPTCERPGWRGASAGAHLAVVRAQAAVDSAEAERQRVADQLETARIASIANATVQLESLQEDADLTAAALDTARGELREANAALAAAVAGSGPAVAWDLARAALGDRPEVPDMIPVSAPPEGDRPGDDEVGAAHETVRKAERAQGAVAQRETDLARLRAQLDASEGSLAEAAAEVGRLEALVEATRRAPSVAAERQLEALGDLGPVSLVFVDGGGVEVLVDGRPYHLASTGRLLVADVWFRAGLRRAIGVPYLPLFVDCIQDVVGQEIPDRPPAVLLRTTEGELGVGP